MLFDIGAEAEEKARYARQELAKELTEQTLTERDRLAQVKAQRQAQQEARLALIQKKAEEAKAQVCGSEGNICFNGVLVKAALLNVNQERAPMVMTFTKKRPVLH